MISAVVQLIQKTVGVIVNASVTASNYGYNLKTVASDVIQTQKTNLTYITGIFFNLFIQKFTENLGASEVKKLEITKGILDNTEVSDLLITRQTVKGLTSIGAASESIGIDTNYTRGFLDTSTSTDNLVYSFVKRPLEAVQLGDQTKSFDISKALLSAVSATDDLNGAAVDDDQNVQFFKVTINGVTLSDNAIVSAGFFREPYDISILTDSKFNDFGKTLTNGGVLSDSVYILTGYARSLQDTFKVASTISIGPTKYFYNQATITDVLSVQNTYQRILTDVANLLDSEVIDNQNIEFNKNLNNGVSILDPIALINVFIRNYQDNSNTVDSAELAYSKGLVDQTQIQDTSTLSTSKGILDQVGISETLDTFSIFNRENLENVVVNDLLSGNLGKSTTNGLSVTDVIVYERGIIRDFGHAGSLTDINLIAVNKNIDNSVSILDPILLVNVFIRDYQDTYNATDSTNLTYSKPLVDQTQAQDSATVDIAKPIPEELIVGDVVNTLSVFNRENSENVVVNEVLSSSISKPTTNSLSVTDVIVYERGVFRNFSDLTTLADSNLIGLGKNPLDTAEVADVLEKSMGYLRPFDHTATVFDLTSNQLSKSLADTSQIFETSVVEVLKVLIDTTGVTQNKTLEVFKTPGEEYLSLSDVYFRQVDFIRTLTSSTDLTDLQYSNFVKSSEDITQFSELLNLNTLKVLQSTISATDDLNASTVDDDQNIQFLKQVGVNFINISVTKAADVAKSVLENLQITSSGVLFNQNYGADYFLEDYVGVSRSLS